MMSGNTAPHILNLST